ncbi:unnamed protein product [Protopolystoma xenopodis]|uniref:Uncharacterized protein n=1 Tax=Protopolystoma xenopodis TaxID=117903 RepID=A0A448WVA4_9PLAT|nr:unnamed protein product [Protopolystoma xenopodis]
MPFNVDNKVRFIHPPPYRFITPSRMPIDLRLHNRPLLERCLSVVQELRGPAKLGWFQEFKEQLIKRLRGKTSTLIFALNPDNIGWHSVDGF